MLLNQMEPQLRADTFQRITQRWEQMHDYQQERIKDIQKWLTLANAGGAVAMLAYIGATAGVGKEAQIPNAMGSLICFVSGYVAVFVAMTIWVFKLKRMQDAYDADLRRFYNNEITFNDLYEKDRLRSKPWKSINAVAGVSFLCFLAGVAVAYKGWLNREVPMSESHMQQSPTPIIPGKSDTPRQPPPPPPTAPPLKR